MNYYLLLLGLLVTVAACTTETHTPTAPTAAETDVAQPTEQVPEPTTEAVNVADADEIKTLPDGTKYLIHPNRIRGGGPPKDGIPSIDNPEFVSVQDADEWIGDDEFGAAIIHNGIKRFYPFQILVWHEIVNENIAGDAVMITYCPLCGSVIGYDRNINGEAVEFGTSGKLYNSNLVMYDRKTDTYWTQIGGKAIIGELTGRELELFPVDVVTWGDWKAAYPDSKVLSRRTGHVRPYGSDPYGDYYTSTRTIFPVDEQDDRLHPKAVIFGIKVNDVPKAYPGNLIEKGTSTTDEIGGVEITIKRDEAGILTFTNQNTNERIPHERDFWFAWFAFHPETELYENS